MTLARRSFLGLVEHDSGEIMPKLDEGETFIVTRNGVPVGELAPLRRHRGRVFSAVMATGRKVRGARAVDLVIAATALAVSLPLYTATATTSWHSMVSSR